MRAEDPSASTSGITDAERVVHAVIERHCGVPPQSITSDTRLAEDLGLQSIDAAELVGSLEDETGLVIDLVALEQLETVASVIDLVRDEMDVSGSREVIEGS